MPVYRGATIARPPFPGEDVLFTVRTRRAYPSGWRRVSARLYVFSCATQYACCRTSAGTAWACRFCPSARVAARSTFG